MMEDGSSSIMEPASDGALEVDEDLEFGATSDYDPTTDAESFCSVTTSIYKHHYEHGRRYHLFNYGKYPIPNDDDEGTREGLKHAMLKELLPNGELYLAPIGDHPQKIIDLGTGFGEWAMDVADACPSAEVIGVDLSPVQPTYVPPNLRFLVDDIEESWGYGTNFDFAHLRFMAPFLKDARCLATNVLRNLRPGGWIEWQELCPRITSDDNSLPPSYAPSRFYEIASRIFRERYGFDIYQAERMKAELQALGFVNVQQRVFQLPVGAWPKDKRHRLIGLYMREAIFGLLPGMGAKPFSEDGIPREEANQLFAEVRKAVSDPRMHARMQFYYVYGQKPVT